MFERGGKAQELQKEIGHFKKGGVSYASGTTSAEESRAYVSRKKKNSGKKILRRDALPRLTRVRKERASTTAAAENSG